MSVSKHKETLLREASRWFARMQGPDAEASRFAFEAWRRSDPEHDLAFRRLEQSWNDASLVAHTSVGRNRSLAAMFDLPLRHQDDGPWELGGA